MFPSERKSYPSNVVKIVCSKNRVNTKLGDLGYKSIISNIDMTAVERMKWFDHLSAGKQHTDFFANRVTNYSKGHMNWDESDIF